MKTVDQIISQYEFDTEYGPVVKPDDAIKAMQEYADQQQS